MVNLNNEQITTVGSKTFETLVELKDLRTLYIKSDYSKGISIQGKLKTALASLSDPPIIYLIFAIYHLFNICYLLALLCGYL